MATKKKPPARSRPASRRGRAEELRRQKEKRSIRNRMVFAAALLVAVGAIFFTALRNSSDSGSTIESTVCTQDSKFDGDSRDHISNPTYEVNPPAGGAHLPAPAQPSFYREGREIPPDGALVHAMEHGFVVLWYKPDLDAAQMKDIETLSDRFGRELILVPRLSLGGPVAVTAWHRRMLCSEIDAAAIAAFTEKYADKGPEKGFM